MPWWSKKTYWTAFPSSALPLWIQYVPKDSEHMAGADRFRIYLTETGADVRIGDDVRFDCSTIVNDYDLPYVKKAHEQGRAIHSQNKTHKSYYSPVLCRKAIVGVLIGRRPIDEKYRPVYRRKSRAAPSENQAYVSAFEGNASNTGP